MTTRTEPLPFDGKPVFVSQNSKWREAILKGYGYSSVTGYQYTVAYKDDASIEKGVLSARIKTFTEALAEGIIQNVYDLKEPAAIAQMVDAHNQWRAKYGVTETVTWDETIAKYAQEWADYLSANNLRQHRSNPPYGENIAYASGKMMSSAEVVALWGNEVNDYNYATNTCADGKVCGHYTQVVWRDSRKIGCGMARTADSKEVWVCNYDPKGNWVGQKPY